MPLSKLRPSFTLTEKRLKELQVLAPEALDETFKPPHSHTGMNPRAMYEAR